MKLLFENGNCVGYDFTETELEAIKSGNTNIVETAAKSFDNLQKEITERIKYIQAEYTKQFQINSEIQLKVITQSSLGLISK